MIVAKTYSDIKSIYDFEGAHLAFHAPSTFAGRLRTLNNMQDKVQAELTTVWQTAEYTLHAFTTHPRAEHITCQ